MASGEERGDKNVIDIFLRGNIKFWERKNELGGTIFFEAYKIFQKHNKYFGVNRVVGEKVCDNKKSLGVKK